MVQGFYFAMLRYSNIQSFTADFITYMQLYRPRNKTSCRALQGLFLRLYPLNRPRYQTGTSGYNAACATLEHITAPVLHTPIPDTRRHAGRYTGQHSRPIIIRYIRAQRCAHVIDPCQTMQHRRPCQPGGVSMLPMPGGLQSGIGQQSERTGSFWHPPPGGAVQRQGARRAARNHRRLSPQLFFGLSPDSQ